ncbi:MAG: YhdP family protein [Gammaproteobacteria bacterium]|nr:TIGR02099 family protein [Pseudomonadales bacterium]MCP5345266.1 TIGR02099 family protein [Pseudomonadales bacterium]
MSLSPLKSLARLLVMAFAVLLILFAAYLSIGRHFMPALTGYTEELEGWLSEALGVPVSVATFAGFFAGANPAIEIEGLQFDALGGDTVGPAEQPGLQFERATLSLDVLQTLLQRRLVLDQFIIQGLDLSVRRQPSGGWMLSGISLQGSGNLDADLVYDTIQRVDRVELTDLSFELQLDSGTSRHFEDVQAVIQNSGGRHFIHVNGVLDGSDEEILLSLELAGDSLDTIGGTVHASLPLNDYSSMAAAEQLPGVVLGKLEGGGQAWLTLEQGELRSAVLDPDLQRLELIPTGGEPLLVTDLSGIARFALDPQVAGWQLAADDLSFELGDLRWEAADSLITYRAGSTVRVYAETLRTEVLSEVILASGRSPELLTERLTGHRPRGTLSNFSLAYSMQETTAGDLFLFANLEDLAVDSYRNAPAMTGINGYLEIDYDADRRVANGLAEVDSENFSIFLPGLFSESWHYTSVNGKLRFEVESQDGFQLRLSSSPIVAESDIVDGRAQFSSFYRRSADGEVDSDLSLLVAALRVDGSKKTPYLPSAPTINPGLYRTMEWLDSALLDGNVFDSGVIYRGPIHRGASEVQRAFQAFFNFNQADVNYIAAWPELNDVAGSVVVDNRSAAIQVQSGQTLGLTIGPTSAAVQEESGGRLWLTIDGSAAGSSQAGLDFLTTAPLEAALGETMLNWEAGGDVEAAVDLRIPLNGTTREPQVLISAEVHDNTLLLPDYQLRFDAIDGVVNFDSVAGLQDSHLTTRLFDGPARVSLESRRTEAAGFETLVALQGEATAAALVSWPGQIRFARAILDRSEGRFDYQAELAIQQDFTRLTLNSDLDGLAMNLPQPFFKAAADSEPLNLQIDFSRPVTHLQGVLGSQLSLRVDVIGQDLDGIVYVGTMPGIADPWQAEIDAPGLELRGNLDVLKVSEWLDVLNNTGIVTSPSRDLTQWVSRVRLGIGELDLFGQQLQTVNIRIEDLLGTDYWTVALDSEAVTGSVLIPFDSREYIEAYLAYLRLPGSTAEDNAAGGEAAAQPVDVLAGLDPRNFPRLKFATGDLSIGASDFGRGRFTLTPEPDGARFSDLSIDFRGFKLGYAEDQPEFLWRYDGSQHHSYLDGVILADNLADVLLANGFAASLESSEARFDARLDWPGSPAFLQAEKLNGEVQLKVEDGRFLQGSGGPGALKLISIINLDAIMRRLRFSDDLLRRGLAYEEITGNLSLRSGVVTINDQLVITGPSSVYQISGNIDLGQQTIDGTMYITLPLSSNIPWLGLLGAISGTLNPSLAIGAYLFERIFGDQVDTLTTAQYRLRGPWEGLQPELEQAFGTPPQSSRSGADPASQGQ